jgi:predicted lactoylglutathione lyase
MHHIDIHVRDVAASKRLFDAIAPLVGWELRSEYPDFVSYWRDKKRPSLGFIQDGAAGSGRMRLAFAVRDASAVDAVADAAAKRGARNIEGPGIHPEYGDDYYAVFFEDAEGNNYEVVRDPEYFA